MNRMMEIANELKKLYYERSGAGIYEIQVSKDLEARKLLITPGEGWPGKNEKEREIARDRVYTADDILKRIQVDLDANRVKATNIGAGIEALEAERRALEWSIRLVLASALAGKRENHAPVEDAGFDEAATSQAVEFGESELYQVSAADHGSSVVDELPF